MDARGRQVAVENLLIGPHRPGEAAGSERLQGPAQTLKRVARVSAVNRTPHALPRPGANLVDHVFATGDHARRKAHLLGAHVGLRHGRQAPAANNGTRTMARRRVLGWPTDGARGGRRCLASRSGVTGARLRRWHGRRERRFRGLSRTGARAARAFRG